MSNKVKDIKKKNRTYYFFNDAINIKNFDFDLVMLNVIQKYSCLLHSICNNERFETCKN